MTKMSDVRKSKKGVGSAAIPKLLDPNEGTPVEVVRTDEKWSECELKDGTILRIRPIIVGVQYHGIGQDGKPIYGMKTSVIVDTVTKPTKGGR
jgi:hypothetical protein